MNKKIIFKMIGLMLIGGVFGAVFSLGLIAGKETIVESIVPSIADAFVEASLYLLLANAVIFIIPTMMYFSKGKQLILAMTSMDDDLADDQEKRAHKNLNKALALNSIMMVINFALFGMGFDTDAPYFIAKLLLFLAIAVVSSTVEIVTVKLMQKHDDRLKGDPISLKFQKDWLESCDEAEKLRIYELAYKAFQFIKNGAFVLLLLTLMLKVTGFTGAFPIFIASIFFMMVLGSYNFYALSDDK